MSKLTSIEKWRVEIELAEDFRNKEFGEYAHNKLSKAGYNIEYYERGISGVPYQNDSDEQWTTLNLFHALIKNIVPTLQFQRPRVIATPSKIESQDTAPVVGQTINHYYKKIEVDLLNAEIVWDAYVLGYGICKIGYATKFGADIEDETKKKKSFADRALEAIGFKKPDVQETIRPEINMNIISETPYISYVSPFNFGIDPRATSINDARFIYEKFRKTVKDMKANKKYKNTERLQGVEPNVNTSSYSKVNQSEIEDFKTVDVYEVHYRTQDKFYVLVISKDSEEWREHYHEERIYDIDGWQYEILHFNKHGHKLYPIGDLSKIRNLQDRFTSTIDSILEQVDRFIPKIAYDQTMITVDGKKALMSGEIAAMIACNGNPREAFAEVALTQFKGDLKAFLEQIIDLVTIQTGLTRAQLTGVSDAGTATEANIEQGGQTIRLSDMRNMVERFSKRQANKLWQVIKQFVELETLELINGVSGIDEQTGLPKYNWLTISPENADKMKAGEYDFDIEVGSTEKPNLGLVRKQFENLFNILARTDVIMLMQQQGKKVDLAELLKLYLQLFPEMVRDIGKIIQTISPETTGLVNPMAMEGGPGGTTAGSNFNNLEQQMGVPEPTVPRQLSEI